MTLVPIYPSSTPLFLPLFCLLCVPYNINQFFPMRHDTHTGYLLFLNLTLIQAYGPRSVEEGGERKRDFAITPLEIIIGFTRRTSR